MPKPLRLLVALFAVLSLSAALAACGDDDDDAATDTTQEEAPEEGGENEAGPPEDAEPLCPEGSTEIFPPSGEPGDDATAVTITATEYAFAGHEPLASQGSYAVSFQNSGKEAHELIVTKIDDDETRSTQDLLAAGQGGENPEDFSEDVASASACPGVTTEVGVDIESPGRYLLICFFPVGAVPGVVPSDDSGPPHVAQGMLQELTVS